MIEIKGGKGKKYGACILIKNTLPIAKPSGKMAIRYGKRVLKRGQKKRRASKKVRKKTQEYTFREQVS